ncbi:MAG: hypothetical protein AAGA68_16260 [Pseudomonadota bacterium]
MLAPDGVPVIGIDTVLLVAGTATLLGALGVKLLPSPRASDEPMELAATSAD